MESLKSNVRSIIMALQSVAIIGLFVWTWSIQQQVDRGGGKKRGRNNPEKVDVDMASLTEGAALKGNETGKVTVALFNSYTCGFCNKVQGPLNELIQKNPEVKIAYKHFVRNAYDARLGQLVECAGDQGKFWEMHDIIFKKARSVKPDEMKPEIFAKPLGLNLAQINQCMDSQKYAKKIQADTLDGRKAGIRATPGFIVNGMRFMGYRPVAGFEQIIKDL